MLNVVGSGAGNLSAGACSNLGFASDSGVACFPATQNSAFQGNLVHFALTEPLPPNSTASIEVIPAAGVDVSLFGYTVTHQPRPDDRKVLFRQTPAGPPRS